MSFQDTAVRGDQPLIPRPERTPDALRAACAVVAPRLLAAYDRAKDAALAEAMTEDSLRPVHACLRHWATLIEVERHPGTAQAYRHAEYMARVATTPEEAHGHLTAAADIYRAAAEAVRAG
ncbi:DUF6247 family protein [Streptomyces sp. G1]|uniref:DUF6247 family protein n=1 Tax=Streptomyces sp. G1 TaxID=361572 RepID=UPI002030418C|nr:DUF6247 family protein [Streptomyces sp. G1]MCM1969844.1 DUF6247 family protein [Streptomyces sp. G1]